MLQSYEAIYDHGRIKWTGDSPQVEEARVIVTVLSPQPDGERAIRRRASPRIAGKGQIVGDIMSPATTDEDWDCLR